MLKINIRLKYKNILLNDTLEFNMWIAFILAYSRQIEEEH